MANGFSLLAPIYDRLARLVFGASIDKSQTHFFESLVNPSTILVVGGGTGRFLPGYRELHQDSAIDFVEKSTGMIARAKSQHPVMDGITFLEADFLDHQFTTSYDVILLPFFLDMFSNDSIGNILRIIQSVSHENTKIIVTDFLQQRSAGWKALLLHLMYLFFRLTCDIEAHSLPDWKNEFARFGWNIIDEATYCKGMIGTHLLQKNK